MQFQGVGNTPAFLRGSFGSTVPSMWCSSALLPEISVLQELHRRQDQPCRQHLYCCHIRVLLTGLGERWEPYVVPLPPGTLRRDSELQDLCFPGAAGLEKDARRRGNDAARGIPCSCVNPWANSCDQCPLKKAETTRKAPTPSLMGTATKWPVLATG